MNSELFKGVVILLFTSICHPAIGQTNAKPDRVLAMNTKTIAIQHFPSQKANAITKNDEANIKWKAENVVTRFMQKLNTLAQGLYSEVPETEKIIRMSYSTVDSKIFYDSNVVIVDDLRHVADNNLAKEKTVWSYLRDFDMFYRKSDSASVIFSNFRISNVKESGYLYIQVMYDCTFKNKSKISDDPYDLRKRVAELKVEKLNNKWKAWIIDVHFLDSLDIVNMSKNDIPILDSADNIIVDNSIEPENTKDSPGGGPADPVQREKIRKQNDSIRTYMAFRNLIDSGNAAFNKGNNISAYQFFNEAETLVNGYSNIISRSDVDFLQTMVREIRKNIDLSNRTPEEIYHQYIQKALVSCNQRKYDDAVDYYNKALLAKPGDETARSRKLELTRWISNLARLNAKYVAGQYRDAINDYDKAIKADSRNSDYYVGRGKCFEKTRDPKKAMNDYRRAIELDQTNLEAFRMKAALHEKQGAFADALACLAVCVTNDKNDIASFQKMAELNMQVGNSNAAIEALDRGILNNSNVAILYHKKGQLLYTLKKLHEATVSLTSAIHFDSSQGLSFYYRGLCEVDMRKIGLAGEDFARAKSLGLDSTFWKRIQQIGIDFYNQGLSQYNSGKIDSSIALLNYAIIIDPLKDEFRFQRGESFFRSGDYGNAIENYSFAIKLNTNNYEAFRQRAMAKFNQFRYKDAILDFEAAIKIDPKNSYTYKYMGDAYLKLKDYSSAIERYDAALAISKSTKTSLDDLFLANLFNNKGESYFQMGNFSTALQNFNNAVKSNKAIGEIYFNRGKTFLKLNELNNAEEDLKKAHGFEGKNPLWNLKLGEIYHQKEKFDKAIYQYSQSIVFDTAKSLFSEPFYKRALCYVQMNNYPSALKDYITIRSNLAEGNYPRFNAELGHIFLELNQPDSALIYYSKANKTTTDVAVIYGIAIAYVQKAQVEEALGWLEKAFSLDKLSRRTISKDKRLDVIRNDKRYKSLMKKYF